MIHIVLTSDYGASQNFRWVIFQDFMMAGTVTIAVVTEIDTSHQEKHATF